VPNNRVSTPSDAPQKLTKDSWYYEDKNSIDLIVWITGYDGNRRAAQIKIPHRKLLATLRRVGKVKL